LKPKCPDVKKEFIEIIDNFDPYWYLADKKYVNVIDDFSELHSTIIRENIGVEDGLNKNNLLEYESIKEISDKDTKEAIVNKIIEINKELIGYYNKAINISKDKEEYYKRLKKSGYKIDDSNINKFYNLVKELYYIFDPKYIISNEIDNELKEKVAKFEKDLYSCPPSYFAQIMENSYFEANATLTKKLYNLTKTLFGS